MAEPRRLLALIGPPGAGKTSCAEHLARTTGRPRVEVDVRCWPLLRAHPAVAAVEPRELATADGDVLPSRRRAWLSAVRERLVAARGETAAARALEEAKARAVIHLVEETCDGAVVDFGAGHSIYEHLDLRAAVKAALARARVVLLLPCADPAAAAMTLADRLGAQGRPVAADRLVAYATHPSNHALADMTMHTERRTLAELGVQLSALAGWCD